MSDRVSVESFEPKTIESGDTVVFELGYSAKADGFIVVNEGPNFDAVPGKIPIKAGNDRLKTASLTIRRQPASKAKECLIMFTLGPSSFTVVVRVK